MPGRHGGGGKLLSAERDSHTMRPLLLRVASDGWLMRDQSIKYMRQKDTHRHGLHVNFNTLCALVVKAWLHAWRVHAYMQLRRAFIYIHAVARSGYEIVKRKQAGEAP